MKKRAQVTLTMDLYSTIVRATTVADIETTAVSLANEYRTTKVGIAFFRKDRTGHCVTYQKVAKRSNIKNSRSGPTRELDAGSWIFVDYQPTHTVLGGVTKKRDARSDVATATEAFIFVIPPADHDVNARLGRSNM